MKTLNTKSSIIIGGSIIFDKSTGESWRKFIPSNEGPKEWTKEDVPFLK